MQVKCSYYSSYKNNKSGSMPDQRSFGWLLKGCEPKLLSIVEKNDPSYHDWIGAAITKSYPINRMHTKLCSDVADFFLCNIFTRAAFILSKNPAVESPAPNDIIKKYSKKAKITLKHIGKRIELQRHQNPKVANQLSSYLENTYPNLFKKQL